MFKMAMVYSNIKLVSVEKERMQIKFCQKNNTTINDMHIESEKMKTISPFSLGNSPEKNKP